MNSLLRNGRRKVSYKWCGNFPLRDKEGKKTAPIKKAAANAAAKVRRWIKELQINVSEQRGDKPKIDSSEI